MYATISASTQLNFIQPVCHVDCYMCTCRNVDLPQYSLHHQFTIDVGLFVVVFVDCSIPCIILLYQTIGMTMNTEGIRIQSILIKRTTYCTHFFISHLTSSANICIYGMTVWALIKSYFYFSNKRRWKIDSRITSNVVCDNRKIMTNIRWRSVTPWYFGFYLHDIMCRPLSVSSLFLILGSEQRIKQS